MVINTPPSLNFCSSSSKAQTKARWIRSCINVHTCRYLVHSILLVQYVLWVSWLIPKVLEDGAYSFFIPRSWAVEGLNNLHRNVFCCLFRFLARSFVRFFKRSLGFPMVLSSLSRCIILTSGQSFDPLFPTPKAEMWSSWVGRVLHTLVTYIVE